MLCFKGKKLSSLLNSSKSNDPGICYELNRITCTKFFVNYKTNIMSKSFFKMQLPLMVLFGVLMVSLVAWKEEKFGQAKSSTTDTLPKTKKIKNLDEALEELEKAQVELERSIKEMPVPSFDAQKMQAELNKALKEIDPEKMKQQMEQAMKEINPEKIKAQVQEAMKQIDPEKIKASVAEAMKEFDAQKLNMQAQQALAKVDMEKLKAQMQEMKKVELPKIEAELKKVKPQMEKAKLEIEKARTELKEYKAFENGLEKDGLINKKENYTIEHKDGQLIINGKIQPEAVYNKYRSFLEKHKKFKLEKDDNDFDIDVD